MISPGFGEIDLCVVLNSTFEPNGVVGVRRLEVITGVGGRGSWSRDDKARDSVSRVVCRARQRVGGGAALRATAAAGLFVAATGPRRSAGSAGGGRGRVCSGRRHRWRRDTDPATDAVAAGDASRSSLPAS